jgi:hypothetical protein
MMRVTLKIPSAPKRVLVAILARKDPVGATDGRVETARDPEYTLCDPSDAAAAEIQIDAQRIFMDSATGGIDDLVEKQTSVCRKRPPASLAAPPESMCVLVEKC